MVIEECCCNWGIPGVKNLPGHFHPASIKDRYEPIGDIIPSGPFKGQHRPRLVRDPDKEPRFFIDWRSYARYLINPNRPPAVIGTPSQFNQSVVLGGNHA